MRYIACGLQHSAAIACCLLVQRLQAQNVGDFTGNLSRLIALLDEASLSTPKI
jgi:hypothetical protein